MTTIRELLEEFAETARTNRDIDTQFERLISNYLITYPQYAIGYGSGEGE